MGMGTPARDGLDKRHTIERITDLNIPLTNHFVTFG